AEALLGGDRGEPGAGAEIGIVELGVALFLLEVRGVLGREKRALVMVEPPGDARRRRILEIDNGILVAGEVVFIEERPGAMHQAHILKLSVLANALAIEAREQRGRAGTVETLVVIEDPNPHKPFLMRHLLFWERVV